MNLCSYYKFGVEIHRPILSAQEDTGSLFTEGLTAVSVAFAPQDLLHLEGMRVVRSKYLLPGLIFIRLCIQEGKCKGTN